MTYKFRLYLFIYITKQALTQVQYVSTYKTKYNKHTNYNIILIFIF